MFFSRKENLAGRRAWVTGASSGIGREVALELGLRGCRVALSARGVDALDALAEEIGQDRALVIAFDVADREANLEAAARLREAWGGLDIAVLNAGLCEYMDIESFDSALFERTMAVNFLGICHGIEAALPLLRASAHGQLVGMGSTAGYRGLPRAEAYGASKAAINYLFESIRLDLLEAGIAVSLICPGFVRTPLTAQNEFPMPFLVEADRAGKIIVDGIARKTEEIHFPKRLSYLLKFLRALPSPVYTWILAQYTAVQRKAAQAP
jgi:NAD(P)-dependent dehydrogenase (short-subunit alcohol dehydrogenase family)